MNVFTPPIGRIPTAPYNNLYVRFKKKYTDEITFASGLKLHVATDNNPAEHVTLVADVVSVPHKVQNNRHDYKGYTADDIRPGDKVITRYDLIFSYTEQPDNDSPVYANLLYLDFHEYWRCSILQIFGFIRGERIYMINGYVMLSVPKEGERKIHLAAHLKALHTVKTAQILQIGRPLGIHAGIRARAGDWVVFNPRVAQHYEINGKPFLIVRQQHIMAVVDEPVNIEV
jgi:co-chaperonin GroES (HSP10)